MRTVRTLCILLAASAVLCVCLAFGEKADAFLAPVLQRLQSEAAAQYAAGEFSVWYLWGVLADALGPLPAFAGLPVLGWCMCCGEGRHLLARSRLKRPARFFVGAALITAGCIAASCTVLGALTAGGLLAAGALPRILWGIAAAAAVLLWSMLSTRSTAQLQAGQALGGIWCVFSTVLLGIILLLQTIAPGGISPSGHTAAAGTLAVLVLACALSDAFEDDEAAWLLAGFVFAAAAGFGRMLTQGCSLRDVCAALLAAALLLTVTAAVFALLLERRAKRSAKPKANG